MTITEDMRRLVDGVVARLNLQGAAADTVRKEILANLATAGVGEEPIFKGAGLPAQLQRIVAAGVAAVTKGQTDRIATLEQEVQKIARQPAPGGPVTRAVPSGKPVAKTLSSAEPAEPEALTGTAAAALAKQATPEERTLLAELLLRNAYTSGDVVDLAKR
jgi:hypothetical protein